jgi:drug/metabolite transporter (DMT)-like permease
MSAAPPPPVRPTRPVDQQLWASLRKHVLAPEAVLMLATAVWGGSFLVTRLSVRSGAPLLFVAARFAIAAALLAAPRPPGRFTRRELEGGLWIGLAMAGGYGLQAIGMQALESGRSAFISALYVPIVPFLQVFVLRRRPPARAWAGIALAFAGLVLLAHRPHGAGAAPLGRSELLTLVGAVAIASEILLVGRYAPQARPRRLAIAQCAATALICLLLGLASGEPLPVGPVVLLSALGLGAASAFLQLAINHAQRTLSPTRATMIYALEPVWAGLFGALAGEQMGLAAIAGAALILASLLVGGAGHAPAPGGGR